MTQPAALDPDAAGTLIGRQPELARLRAVWEQARAGSTRVVLLAGEPGVGKTRLAAELAGIVEASGATVLAGRCRPDGPVPYEPLLEALAPRLAQRPTSWLRKHAERHGPVLATMFPDVARRVRRDAAGNGSQHGNDKADPVGPRARLLSGLVAAVADSPKEPVLLILEDLHWATRSTVLVIEHLRHTPAAPLLVLGTYRDAAIFPNHPLASLLDDPSAEPVERIVLANLSPQAVAALLVDRAAFAGKAAADLARTLWRATEGNAFLLTEVVRDLQAAGALNAASIDADTADSAAADVGVPHNVEELVGRRLGRPAASVRDALEAAAVIGSAFAPDLVADVLDRKEDDVAAALEHGAATSLVRTAATPAPGATVEFVHDLVREALYVGLPANRRVRLHRAVADALQTPERAGTVTPAVLVHHLAAAAPVGRSPGAVEQARRAGEAALAVLAYEEAAEMFGQALAFLGSGGDAGTRADLLMLLGEAYHQARESARARQSYLQAAAVARAHGDGPRLGRAVLGLGDVFGVWGADALLIGMLEQAAEANPDDPSLRAKLLARLAQARAAFDSPDERKAQSDRAWELAWDSRDPDTMGAVLRARHEALSAPDDLEDRVEIDGELYAMAVAASDPDLAVLAHGWRLVDLLEQGHLVDADRDRKLHAQLARRSKEPAHQRDAAMWAATWALLQGKVRRATTEMDRALAFGQQAKDPAAPSLYWAQQLGLLLEWGSDAELDGLIDVWRDLSRSHDAEPAWRASLALLLARTGRLGDAKAELDDLLSEEAEELPADRDWIPTVTALGEVAARLDDPRALSLARLLQPYGRRLVVVGPGAACHGAVARVMGLLFASVGSWPMVERHFQSALSTHDRIDAPPLVARTRSEFGRALARKDGGPLHTGRVKAMLEQALDEAEQLGMTRLATETQAALEALPSRNARNGRSKRGIHS